MGMTIKKKKIKQDKKPNLYNRICFDDYYNRQAIQVKFSA